MLLYSFSKSGSISPRLLQAGSWSELQRSMSVVCISSVSCLFPSSTSITRRQSVDSELRCMISYAQGVTRRKHEDNILMKGLWCKYTLRGARTTVIARLRKPPLAVTASTRGFLSGSGRPVPGWLWRWHTVRDWTGQETQSGALSVSRYREQTRAKVVSPASGVSQVAGRVRGHC